MCGKTIGIQVVRRIDQDLINGINVDILRRYVTKIDLVDGVLYSMYRDMRGGAAI